MTYQLCDKYYKGFKIPCIRNTETGRYIYGRAENSEVVLYGGKLSILKYKINHYFETGEVGNGYKRGADNE